MPAKSKVQQIAMAIAEHEPEKLYARNRGLLKMSKGQLGEYASTPRAGIPRHVGRSTAHQHGGSARRARP